MPRHRGQADFPLDSSTSATLVSTPTSPTQSNFPSVEPIPFPSTSIDEDEQRLDPHLSRFPALGLILSFTTKSDYFVLLIPGVISSIISGLLPSYMTILIGEAFEAFTLYTLSSGELDSSSAKLTLRSSIGSVSLRLLLIGLGSCVLSLLNHALWSIYAARVCERLQTALYNALSSRPLSWFDNGMRTSQHHLLHSPPPNESAESDSATSSAAAGVMSRFARETDEVRTALSSRIGLVLQYSVTFLVNVILAFTKSYKLSLVILSTIPLIAIITAVISGRVAPFVALQNTLEAALSGELTRVLRTITLVKAFNAQPLELLNLTRLARRLSQNYDQIVLLFALRLGTTHSLALLMFVQGFGFGSHLISTGQVTPGDVNTVFWSSLIASSHMQMAIPLLGQLERTRPAILDLLSLLETPSPFGAGRKRRPSLIPLRELNRPVSASLKRAHSIATYPNTPRPSMPSSVNTKNHTLDGYQMSIEKTSPRAGAERGLRIIKSVKAAGSRIFSYTNHPVLPPFRPLRKRIPAHFQGQLEFENVHFAYPNSSEFHSEGRTISQTVAPVPILKGVSMFFPAGDLTFVVGESGSGKSTVAVLALGLYSPDVGSVTADELGPISGLDPDWVRTECFFLGSFAAQFLLPGTIHENIALGVCPRRPASSVSRDEVTRAARFALLHEFVSGLPNGYDTIVAGHDSRLSGLVAGKDEVMASAEDTAFSTSGDSSAGSLATLSGGQLQRLGLARAYLRDPTVLILDEPVSALDLVSQSLLAAAIRQWRHSKTTIWITHDLSPIEPNDFVYLLDAGHVIEADYLAGLRHRLASRGDHVNNSLARLIGRSTPALPAQLAAPDKSPLPPWQPLSVTPIPKPAPTTNAQKRGTLVDGFLRGLNPTTASDGLLAAPPPSAAVRASNMLQTIVPNSYRTPNRLFLTPMGDVGGQDGRETRSRSWLRSRSATPSSLNHTTNRRMTNTIGRLQDKEAQTEEEYREIAMALLRVGQLASERRGPGRERRIWVDTEKGDKDMENDKRKSWWGLRKKSKTGVANTDEKDYSNVWLVTKIWGTLEAKVRICCGIAVSIVAGVLTPVFSALLGQLLARLADPPAGYIKRQSILIAVVAVVDGLFSALRIWLMEGVGTVWLEDMRGRGLRRVVLKDLTWFASPRNESSKLVNRFIKDGVEARELVSQILADLLTIVTLLVVAFAWAMVVGWELTLVGLSLAPIFFVVIGGGGKILGRLELDNKRWRESVAMEFYLTMNQMKAIRVLSIDGVMRERFQRSVMGSKSAFIRASPFGGIPYGLNTALAYSAEALMFYVGSQWVVEGRYSFEKMTQVFSLIIFSVTFAGQMISYVPSISRSARAFIDLLEILEMSIESKELKGDIKLNRIQGSIQFDHVYFSYPLPDLEAEKEEEQEEKHAKANKVNVGPGLVPVLRSVSFSIRPGECVGIVGPSGSGKSTIAGLIQRFYEPDQGNILVDGYPLNKLDVQRLREVIGVVGQHPMLSNEGTILENVCYGHTSTGEVAAERAAWAALEDVNLAGLVRGRPEGLHSRLGQLSSGEAERMAIARMLVSRESRAIVVLDEPTAALDLLNQRIILKTIMRLKAEGKTVVLITHQMSVMRACDRLVVLQAGQVIETGSVEGLMRDRPTGIFATLARGGEWGGG